MRAPVDRAGELNPQELARLLEREQPCERCHNKPSIGIFDRLFLCGECRAVMEAKLRRGDKRPRRGYGFREMGL